MTYLAESWRVRQNYFPFNVTSPTVSSNAGLVDEKIAKQLQSFRFFTHTALRSSLLMDFFERN